MQANDGGMQAKRLILNPEIPLSWEEPETIRFGFDRVLARLVAPSPGIQHVLVRLRDGVTPEELPFLAKGFGVSNEQLDELMSTLGPVLRTTKPVPRAFDQASRATAAVPPRENETKAAANPPHASEHTLIVVGRNEAAERFREHCTSSGFRPPQPGNRPGVAILVDHFWGATAHSQSLLRDQIPHLIVRFTDRAFFVGPILIPNGELCQNCIELHALATDPQLRLVAAQLATHTPTALSNVSLSYASVMAFTALQNWQRGSTELLEHRLRVPVRKGLPSLRPKREALSAHEKCACIELMLAQRPLAAESEAGLFDKTRGQPL